MWLNLDMISFQYLIHSEINWVALRNIVVTPCEDKPTKPLTVDLPEMKRLTDWNPNLSWMTGIQVSNSLLKGTKLLNSFQLGSLQSCYFSFLFSMCLALDSKAFCFCNRYTDDAFFFAEQSIRVPIPCSRNWKSRLLGSTKSEDSWWSFCSKDPFPVYLSMSLQCWSGRVLSGTKSLGGPGASPPTKTRKDHHWSLDALTLIVTKRSPLELRWGWHSLQLR